MKANEILGMVEEAAGTRMYETKRIAALKTIEKKQMKVDEINAVLSEEITPTLERLRGEKQNYLKWSKNNADVERVHRFVIASDFDSACKALEHNMEGVCEMKNNVAILLGNAEKRRTELMEKEVEISARSKTLTGDFGDQLQMAKATEEQLAKELVKATSAWQNSQTIVKGAESDLVASNQVLTETRETFDAKHAQIIKESDRIEKIKKEALEAEAQHEELKADYQKISAGITSSQGDAAGTLPQQIALAATESKTAEAKAKQAKMKIDHLAKTLKVSQLRSYVEWYH